MSRIAMNGPMIIDTDMHVTEPADVFTDRISVQRWGDLVPHVKWDSERRMECWYVGDRFIVAALASAAFGWDGVFPNMPPTYADAHPACYDAKARVDAMDAGNIRAACLYPNLGGGLHLFTHIFEPELLLESCRAYNDWLLDWSSVAPGRFVPLACLPYWDVDASIVEIERTAAIGHKGFVTTGAPHAHGQPYLADRHWDRMWAALQAAGLPVSFHAAGGDTRAEISAERVAADGPWANNARASTTVFLDNGMQLNDLLLSGVLARYPELRFVCVESGVGWIPFVLESADYHFRRSRVAEHRAEFDLLPSEYFRRQVYANYWFEKLEPWHVAAIGEDHILFETDLPHPTCLYGNEVEAAIEGGLADHPEELQAKILWGNASQLYGLPPMPADRAFVRAPQP
jgi:predicted TIM-barrel fold metal-dependent hydrolase